MHLTATQAQNRFGVRCAQAKTEPEFVEKDGRIETVILSAKHFSGLQAANRLEWPEGVYELNSARSSPCGTKLLKSLSSVTRHNPAAMAKAAK